MLDRLPPEQRKQKLIKMMQSLLRGRFKLVLGHETKELPVYLLVAAKNGPKLKLSDFKLPEHPGELPLAPEAGHFSPPPPPPQAARGAERPNDARSRRSRANRG